jgi:hypothetical protein
MAADLVRRKDVIVASSQGPALAAKRATTTIPIVMVNATDPVQAGLVASLARPGGNVTGLSEQLTREIRAKQLQLLTRLRRWPGIASTRCWCRETPFCSRSGGASPTWPWRPSRSADLRIGSPSRTRTYNPPVNSRMLYH